jgi:hypothetical protein
MKTFKRHNTINETNHSANVTVFELDEQGNKIIIILLNHNSNFVLENIFLRFEYLVILQFILLLDFQVESNQIASV